MNEINRNFQEIYEGYRPQLMHYLSRLVGEAEAEDLVQEVFIKVNRALANFRGDSTLSTWLYRIATHTAYDRRRSPAFQQLEQNEQAVDLLGDDMVEVNICDAFTGDQAPPIEQQYVKKELSACVLNRLDALPESYRTVLVLSDMEGLSNKEIAQILGVTLDTVKIRIHRARAMLREQILSHCEYYWVSELSWQAA
jgi:RNA polymerase sigma-70 factor (ECF subfamily)